MATAPSGLGPYPSAGVPGGGTSAVQTLTIGGTPNGGTFRLRFRGPRTDNIAWSATNASLVANVQAALQALSNVGSGNVTVAVGAMTAGIGTLTITFAGKLATAKQSLVQVANNALTGTAPSLAVTETTPGVDATLRGLPRGAMVIDTVNAIAYINTGTPESPVYTKVGTQT
jgi:hypothetical protein